MNISDSKCRASVWAFLLLAVSILLFAGVPVLAEEGGEAEKEPTEAVTYTVTFAVDGGSEVEAQKIVKNEENTQTVTEPESPVKEGYDFTGWYINDHLTEQYDFSQPVTEDKTLYAGWAQKAAEPDPSTEDTEDTGTETTGTEDTGTESTGTENTGTESTGTESTKEENTPTTAARKENTKKVQTKTEKFSSDVKKLDMTKAGFVTEVNALWKRYGAFSKAEKNKVKDSAKQLTKYKKAISKKYSCGSGTYYYYDASRKTLTIFGKGKMKDLFKIFYMEKKAKQVKKRAYNKVASKVKKVVIGEGVTCAGNGAFAYMTKLTSVEIKGTGTSLGKSVFFGCKKLSKVTFSGNAKKSRTIGFVAFGECTSLKSITIPEGTKKIDKSAFYKCKKLSQIDLPSTLTSVGYTCFYNCTSLKTITVRGSIKKCGSYAFYGIKKKGRKVVCKTKKAAKCKFVKAAKKAGFKIKK